MTAPPGFIQALRNAGISPLDSEEIRLKKSLLVFATGLMSVASVLWLLLYWQMGPHFSATIPFVFALLLATNLFVYLKSGNFPVFRALQLGLFLFIPFVVQWSMGSFITASGVSLWGLLAPVGAILIIGPRESLPWFITYLFLTALSGFFDYFLADGAAASSVRVTTQTSAFFFALNFATVSTLVFLLLRYSAGEKEQTQLRLEEAHRQLQAEQDRSERLLLNILPGPIAERLKNSNQTIADGFADVTVMFVDIVNFTQVAEGLSPQQVFSMLNRIFSTFDELAEQFGLEKIKTIGDAYMAAGGLNAGNDQEDGEQIDYTEAIANLALTMRELLHENFDINRRHLEVRIGIGTGPVVAGVVGKKKFIYDLWGDTVNIASRITSEGMPGMIQVDETTYRRLRGRFDFEPPQTLRLKGKGETVIYRLIGNKVPAPVPTLRNPHVA